MASTLNVIENCVCSPNESGVSILKPNKTGLYLTKAFLIAEMSSHCNYCTRSGTGMHNVTTSSLNAAYICMYVCTIHVVSGCCHLAMYRDG